MWITKWLLTDAGKKRGCQWPGRDHADMTLVDRNLLPEKLETIDIPKKLRLIHLYASIPDPLNCIMPVHRWRTLIVI
jgi:hypothetical protein